MGCPVCAHTEYMIKGKGKTNSISEKFIEKDYNVVQCLQCRTYYVAPEITFSDKQWSDLYNGDYFAIQSKWLINQRKKELKKRFDKVKSFLQKDSEITMLDIGSGEGRALIEGESRGWNVTGIDIVDNRINKARIDGVTFIKGKFPDIKFSENTFDFIYVDSVLEHVAGPLDYLKKIKTILKPGGIAYIGVPNEDSLFNDIRRLTFNLIGRKNISEKIKPFDSPYHIIGFNSHSLNYAFDKAGFKILLFRNFGRKFEFLSSPPTHKSFWLSLFFLFPVEIIGNLTKKDVYYEIYLKK